MKQKREDMWTVWSTRERLTKLDKLRWSCARGWSPFVPRGTGHQASHLSLNCFPQPRA